MCQKKFTSLIESNVVNERVEGQIQAGAEYETIGPFGPLHCKRIFLQNRIDPPQKFNLPNQTRTFTKKLEDNVFAMENLSNWTRTEKISSNVM